MASATATNRAASATELLEYLAEKGETTLADILGIVDEKVIALAWSRGEIEFGKTRYVLTGNPDTAITVHNGINVPAPALVIEGGMEWSGPKQRWHQPFHELKRKILPVCQRYQKYQLEVCVNKEKDVWDWLPEGEKPGSRESRYARREIDRAEAERLFEFRVRLTDNGHTALASKSY